MPAKRRSTAPRTAPASQQSTLSFHSKVTKPSARQDAKDLTNTKTPTEDVINIDSQSSVEEPQIEDVAVKAQPEPEVEAEADPLETTGDAVKTEDVLGGRAEQSDVGAVEGTTGSGWVGDEEAKARKISDTQIKKYWRAKEAERLAPRIHQGDLTVYEKILREWDMSNQYGPCIGIARLKRWKRANVLGMNPPIEVLAVLLKELDGGNAKSERAYVDELMASHTVEAV